ncbi:hypothetical protein Maes01_01860 [Microbulbifer aestuariivivens]|uniref:Uncharacterized protein n=1 Tax=Microbulbifer aestuariivivens TaxID=1908308 RepID=A0ABP9WQJ6_9GAMM
MGFTYFAKATLLFIGRSMLFGVGLASLIFVFVDFFEDSLTFSELSLLEIGFGLLLFSLINRHLTASKAAQLKWTSAIYRPLRNIGWVNLAFLCLVIFFILIGPEIDELNQIMAKNSHRLQQLDLIVTLLCLYWAAPKLPVEQTRTESVNKEGLAQ